MFINWIRAKGIRIRYYKVVGRLVKLFSSHPRPAEECNKPAAVRELKELAQNCADVWIEPEAFSTSVRPAFVQTSKYL